MLKSVGFLAGVGDLNVALTRSRDDLHHLEVAFPRISLYFHLPTET